MIDHKNVEIGQESGAVIPQISSSLPEKTKTIQPILGLEGNVGSDRRTHIKHAHPMIFSPSYLCKHAG